MNPAPSVHPDLEQLAAFGLGRLDESESALIEAHLADCDACRSVVESVPDDPLVALVKAPVPPISTGEFLGGCLKPVAPLAPVPARVPKDLVDHPRYRIQELLGVGGMGAVYRAEHELMERTVALKVIHQSWSRDAGMVERFRREVKAAARLTHPNIVTAYDAEQAGDSLLLVMEYVEGTSLARLVAENGPLPVSGACDYIRQAAQGLQHAFERGMVHRDIKPQNLMRTPDGQVKILDFGLARFAAENVPSGGLPAVETAQPETPLRPAADTPADSLTQTGTIMGTPDYIAPEQARDAHGADIRADIYSLGCTLYDLLAGRPPFPEGTAMQKVLGHVERQPTPLTELRPEVPESLAGVVERMMAKDPAVRYQTPAQVAEALALFAGDRPPARGRRRLTLALVSVALLGVLVLVASFVGTALLRDRDQRPELPPGPPGPEPKAVQPSPLAEGEVRRFEGHRDKVWSVALSVDGKWALSGSSDKTVRLWDVETGLERKRFVGHTDRVESVAFSPNGPALSGSADRTVRLWDVATAEPARVFKGHESVVTSVAFSPDGHLALSGALDRTLRLWDLDTGKELRCFRGHTWWVYRVAFAPDGKSVLSVSPDNTVRLWDMATGHERRRFGTEKTPIWSTAFSPDGRRLLTGYGGEWAKGMWMPGPDNSIRIWDVATGASEGRLIGHTDGVMSLAFSPDGRRALSGGVDKTVRLWDVESARELHCFRGHTDRVMGVAYAPDGLHALSGSWDKTVRLWRLPP
jgi:WD40 repeat protein/serine/threonine protein kinase